MEEEKVKRIQGLLRRLMAAEAREIYLEERKRVNWRNNHLPNPVDVGCIKKEIIDYLAKQHIRLSIASVQKYALKYLEEQETVGTANPSYRLLREQIERGEYDFSFVEYKKP